MRIEKREGSKERTVLIGMIVDKTVLAEVADKWTKEGLFSSTWANIIGNWCVDFYRRYEDAPGKAVTGLYEAWAESSGDKDGVKLVGKFLEEVSGEWARLGKESNSKVVIDQAAKLFNRVRAARLKDRLEGYLDTGDVEKAIKSIQTFDQVEMGVGTGVDLFTDPKAIVSTFDRLNEPPVVEYPGALGKFFGNTFRHGAFVAFMGPEKRGKSFWLLDVAYRALVQRRRVAHFECGDLTEDQIKERYLTRAARAPLDSDEGWPLTVKLPTDIIPPQAAQGREEETGAERKIKAPEVPYEDLVFKKPITPAQALESCSKLMKERLKSKESYFKLFCYPNSSLSVETAEAKLRQVERATGWRPDLVVFDYADILASPAGFSESRDAVNANWKRLRRMSMERNCCVVTASQTNTASYQAGTIEKWNFSEDKRKLAHVTAMIGLNQAPEEEKVETMRLNFVVRRKGRFQSKRMVYVAMCLALANPAVRSAM